MYDVVIIGAGVTGCAIAHELSRYDLSVCVLDKEDDVGCGTSKANSAIVHAGYDATPGSLKAKLNVLGNQMIQTLSKELDFPFKSIGSLVVCTKDQDKKELDLLYEKGQKNKVPGLKILEREEILTLEPHIAEDVSYALYAPTGGIVCPFHLTIAFAEHAAINGIEFRFNTPVLQLTKAPNSFLIQTDNETIESRLLINAAGVYADTIHNMLSSQKIHITPRKGEYLLLDKDCGNYVSHVIFQLPSAMGKGVLVTPTVHGNLLVGPTAFDLENKEETSTSLSGIVSIMQKSSQSIKDIPYAKVITSFAGLRAHEDCDDFIVGPVSDVAGLYDAAGIESPGLTSAPAIGKMIGDMIFKQLEPSKNEHYIPTRKGFLAFGQMTMEEKNALIQKDPAYGNIVCRCELVTEGEIIQAIQRPLGAKSLDGIKRRTRAGMGRCQSGFCMPKTMEILERELKQSAFSITKSGHDSNILQGYNKHLSEEELHENL